MDDEAVAVIVIRHSRAEGTSVDGDTRPVVVREILKRKRYGRRGGMGFRWSKTVGAWIRYHTRDHKADTWSIDRPPLALRSELGLKVCRVVDNATRRSFAEAEAERYEKAEDCADRFAEYGANATSTPRRSWSARRSARPLEPRC
ncbi:hypothetical protein ACWD25_13360 [Streptomyces sp. NPDC002920]